MCETTHPYERLLLPSVMRRKRLLSGDVGGDVGLDAALLCSLVLDVELALLLDDDERAVSARMSSRLTLRDEYGCGQVSRSRSSVNLEETIMKVLLRKWVVVSWSCTARRCYRTSNGYA